jgi:hypothetical protein
MSIPKGTERSLSKMEMMESSAESSTWTFNISDLPSRVRSLVCRVKLQPYGKVYIVVLMVGDCTKEYGLGLGFSLGAKLLLR